jgi:hypothetical protein
MLSCHFVVCHYAECGRALIRTMQNMCNHLFPSFVVRDRYVTAGFSTRVGSALLTKPDARLTQNC